MAWRWNIDRGRGLEGAALAACIGFAVAVLWLVLRLVRLLVPAGDPAYDGTAVHVGDAAGAPSASIAKWHLFGDTPVAAGGGASAAQSMILRGTLADRDPASGIAVIDAGSGERAYRAGEIVASNVRLVGVYADRVKLSRDGVESTLTLTRDRNLMPANIVRQPSASATRSRGSASPEPSRADASATRAIPPETQKIIERAREHPEDLARLVQIAPVVEGGRVTGVRVGTGTDAALMNAMGL
ncbi:MAG TPA: type II secretion system protein N, partial [Rhodanobacteraceae bacterium]|nr:type II secretion system protein N [Rhodanobacteraceae bacterium]